MLTLRKLHAQKHVSTLERNKRPEQPEISPAGRLTLESQNAGKNYAPQLVAFELVRGALVSVVPIML